MSQSERKEKDNRQKANSFVSQILGCFRQISFKW